MGKWNSRKMRTETVSRNRNDQRKMPDEGYNVNVEITFYSLVLLSNIVGPFCTVSLK